jgi:hypothetical protein
LPVFINSIREVFVIYSINLARTSDQRSIGEDVRNLLGDWTVRAGPERSCENRRSFVIGMPTRVSVIVHGDAAKV